MFNRFRRVDVLVLQFFLLRLEIMILQAGERWNEDDRKFSFLFRAPTEEISARWSRFSVTRFERQEPS